MAAGWTDFINQFLENVPGSQSFRKHFLVILKFHDEKGTLKLSSWSYKSSPPTFLSLRILMGQITTLMGVEAFDMEMTWSWMEPGPDCASQGSRAVQKGSALEFIC